MCNMKYQGGGGTSVSIVYSSYFMQDIASHAFRAVSNETSRPWWKLGFVMH